MRAYTFIFLFMIFFVLIFSTLIGAPIAPGTLKLPVPPRSYKIEGTYGDWRGIYGFHPSIDIYPDTTDNKPNQPPWNAIWSVKDGLRIVKINPLPPSPLDPPKPLPENGYDITVEGTGVRYCFAHVKLKKGSTTDNWTFLDTLYSVYDRGIPYSFELWDFGVTKGKRYNDHLDFSIEDPYDPSGLYKSLNNPLWVNDVKNANGSYKYEFFDINDSKAPEEITKVVYAKDSNTDRPEIYSDTKSWVKVGRSKYLAVPSNSRLNIIVNASDDGSKVGVNKLMYQLVGHLDPQPKDARVDTLKRPWKVFVDFSKSLPADSTLKYVYSTSIYTNTKTSQETLWYEITNTNIECTNTKCDDYDNGQRLGYHYEILPYVKENDAERTEITSGNVKKDGKYIGRWVRVWIKAVDGGQLSQGNKTIKYNERVYHEDLYVYYDFVGYIEKSTILGPGGIQQQRVNLLASNGTLYQAGWDFISNTQRNLNITTNEQWKYAGTYNFTLEFSEKVDTGRPFKVSIITEKGNSIPISTVSWNTEGNIWQGRLSLSNEQLVQYAGLCTLSVEAHNEVGNLLDSNPGTVAILDTVQGRWAYYENETSTNDTQGGKDLNHTFEIRPDIYVFGTNVRINDDIGSYWQGGSVLNTGPMLAYHNGRIYSVWTDGRKRTRRPYTAWSDNGGVSFSTNKSIGDTNSTDPCIAVSEQGSIYVASIVADAVSYGYTWTSITRSFDSGYSFTYPIKIYPNSYMEEPAPSIAVGSDGTVYVVFCVFEGFDTHGWPIWNICFSKSTDFGATFTMPKKVETRSVSSGIGQFSPQIAVDRGGIIYIVWHEQNVGQNTFSVRFAVSEDGGTTFTKHKTLAGAPYSPADYPFANVDTLGNVYIAYDTVWDIYIRKSIDKGTTFQSPIRVNDRSSECIAPKFDIDDNGTVYVVWEDKRNGVMQVYFARSDKGMNSFGMNVRVQDWSGGTPYDSHNPLLLPDIEISEDKEVYVMWIDSRDPITKPDVYFARGTIGGVVPTLSGKDVLSVRDKRDGRKVLPDRYNLFQNYPNPFNPETEIKYQIPITQNVSLLIYDITGKLIKTLVNEKKDAGYYTVRWNGKDDNGMNVPSGVYLYKIKTEKFIAVGKAILLK